MDIMRVLTKRSGGVGADVRGRPKSWGRLWMVVALLASACGRGAPSSTAGPSAAALDQPVPRAAPRLIWEPGEVVLPPDALKAVVRVVGDHWDATLGDRTLAREVRVPVDCPIAIEFESAVKATFVIPAMRVRRVVEPGRKSHVWFQGTRVGEYPVYFMLEDGSRLVGKVVVMTAKDFARQG